MYQHATRDRDQAIAQALGELARHVPMPYQDHTNEPVRIGDPLPVWHVGGTGMVRAPIRLVRCSGR